MSSSFILNADEGTHSISRHIYGHFAEHLGRCIYGGFWVGEKSKIPNVRGIRKDVVAALRDIRIPNLRWPGGCFADEYHWTDGIGPRSKRPCMINTHWGGVTENNHFGTHEFMDLCAQLDCEPYICGNVGSGTVQEMQQWVEYLTFDGVSPMADLRRKNGRQSPWQVRYWGVGNENWGCGGSMRPEFYADNYRRYATYCRNFSGNWLYKIACGPNNADYHWTEVLMRECAPHLSGLALHYYCGTGKASRSATQFDESDWFHLLKSSLTMDELVTRHSTIMDKYDPQGRVGLIVDEWGTRHAVEPGTNPGFLYQQNTLRDAMVAALTFNIFHRHARRVHLANIAQTVNVLQAVILTEGEKMLLTPTYHAYDLYQVHQDATFLPLTLQTSEYKGADSAIPAVSATASRNAQGVVHLSLVNVQPEASAEVSGDLRGLAARKVSGRLLTAGSMQAHNTFEKPTAVKPIAFTGATLKNGRLTLELPPKSIVTLAIG